MEIRGDVAVGIVCDGCSSGSHSEVGAKIGARIWLEEAFRQLGRGYLPDRPEETQALLDKIEAGALVKIRSIADAMGSSLTRIVSDYFLFTVVGFIVDPRSYATFVAGDGVVIVAHDGDEFGPEVYDIQAGNQPAYPAYRLVPSNKAPEKMRVIEAGLTEVLQAILVGTDGVQDLIDSPGRRIPGKDEQIGLIEQFWKTDRYFTNPFAIGHRLNLINRSISRVDYETRVRTEDHGPLRDDTSFAIIRRRP